MANKRRILALCLALVLVLALTACGEEKAQPLPELFNKMEVTKAQYQAYDAYSVEYKQDESTVYAFLEEAAANKDMNYIGNTSSGDKIYVFTDEEFIKTVADKIENCQEIKELSVVMGQTTIVFSILYQYDSAETMYLTYSNHGYVTKTLANTDTKVVTILESGGEGMYAMTRTSTTGDMISGSESSSAPAENSGSESASEGN